MAQLACHSSRAACLPASGLVSEELRGGNIEGRHVHPGMLGESCDRGLLSGIPLFRLTKLWPSRRGVDGDLVPAPTPSPAKLVIWLILPVVICLSQRLSHACLSISNLYCETANGSLNQLSFI